MENPQIELARRYVEQTGVSLFLTGKAGTGKTTFLHDLDRTCHKRHIVVAPTGVAAVNAGGVTIHSFFQLPFDPYLPDVPELVTEYQVSTPQRSMGKTKLGIIRTLELLIIDEVSMVRADLLDAVDMVLRRVRRSSRPFGGVQLLLIGDVHQLPPVVTETERPYMERVYPSPFFFNSKALQRVDYVTIELTTVFRQQDAAFVELLNRVRDNRIDAATLSALNSRLGAATAAPDRSLPITLTTHNHQADAINRARMQALDGEARSFEAAVEGNYPESMFPVERTMEVKVGERVMFTKNDTSGAHRYYNGKLATVTGFSVSDDKADLIEVIDDDGDVINVGRERWENIKYTLAADGAISQQVDGTFCQYPLRPAWAVTIHKAQGLTFDRVCINAADAFAFGQVYVALSRCRTLEGLSLTTPLSPSVAFSDTNVQRFCAAQPTFDQTADALPRHEAEYYYEQLADLFSADALATDAGRLAQVYNKLASVFPKNCKSMEALYHAVLDLASVGERFRNQLLNLPLDQHPDRIAKAAEYYTGQLKAFASALAAVSDIEIDNKETRRQFAEALADLTDRLGQKQACIAAVADKGFSVAAVQKAKADYVLQKDKGGDTAKSARGAKRRKAAQSPDRAATPLSGRPAANEVQLTEHLRLWRKSKAEELGIPPFMILSQKALMGIVAATPRTAAQLLAVDGVGRITVQRYGNDILEIVQSLA